MSDYYDVSLKKDREALLLQNSSYRAVHERIEASKVLLDLFHQERPDIVIHLAAQAGVRHSIENPRMYLESNINGTFELLEAARQFPPKHMLLASTSSVYGASEDMPYKETTQTDQQMSFYAATKKSTENMSHSYSHLYDLPITMFRFFTVYGPWGRPDMAIFKFTKSILNDQPIDVYNNGKLSRDFTYIDDLTHSIKLLIGMPPNQTGAQSIFNQIIDSKSQVAPFNIVNIGNSKPVRLMSFINNLEKSLGKKARKNFMPMQLGDVPATWADTSNLMAMTGYQPSTPCEVGIQKFVDWYLHHYNITNDTQCLENK